MKLLYTLLPLLGVLLIACEDDELPVDAIPSEPIVYTSGSADFSTYVALGNSLTAGYSDNALFVAGQEASYPNMLANNFALVGGGPFTIPFMTDNLGGATLGGTPIFGNRLIFDFAAGAPVPLSGQGRTEISNKLQGLFNNMGIPGAKSFELLAPNYGSVSGVASGTANPYFARFSSSESATVLEDAVAQNATFFSLWIGANDVLAYATGGGTGAANGNPSLPDYSANDITDPTFFAGALDAILQAMTGNGAKGVVANLPNVTDIPFFTTVPYNAVPLDAATAASLNQAYAAYNTGLAQLQGMGVLSQDELTQRTISFTEGAANAVVILDEALTDLTGFNASLINMRQATAEDLLVLTSSSFIGSLANPSDPNSINGVAIPLDDQWVLTPEEQSLVEGALLQYNQTIEALATQYDLAFVDANALLNQLSITGFPLPNGDVVTKTFVTGGGFSLDGVHPSPRGYAILANTFVEAINEKYSSNLPGVNPLDFVGLYIN